MAQRTRGAQPTPDLISIRRLRASASLTNGTDTHLAIVRGSPSREPAEERAPLFQSIT